MTPLDSRYSQVFEKRCPVQPVSSTGDVDWEAAGSTDTTDPFANLPFRSGAPAPLQGHLQNLKKVGQGRFGEVYRAWDAQLERDAALKLCRSNGCCTEHCFQSCLQEARVLARIRHPGVVTVYGVGHYGGRVGVWMEYIRGRTLEALLREHGPLPARQVTLIGLELCAAVAAVHASGLLHCDIKTKNVMREDGGRIVLLDFGISRDLQQTSLTVSTQNIRGTPSYMAPELLRNEKASVQTDIYGIGVLLYRLLTGCFPVSGRGVAEVRRAYERGEAKLLRERRAGLPEPLLRAVERSLSSEPEGRFATAGEMAQALSASLGGKVPLENRTATVFTQHSNSLEALLRRSASSGSVDGRSYKENGEASLVPMETFRY